MKRIFIMLLITCSAIATYAQQNDKSLAQPTHVIELLNGIISDFGQTSDQIYSVQKNPNTNQLESSIRIVKFLAENKEWFSEDIGDCFIKDEPVSYQMQHFSPGNKEMFGINVKNINGGPHNHYMVRTSTQQEMWLMCVKNTENPQLRDAYAIVWEKAEDLKVKGTVFMITSIRPDIYTQNYEGNTEMSTVTNVINPNAAIDPLLKMSRQDDEAKEWMKSLSPEQLFSVMQMSTTMRADIMKAAPIYQTLNKLIKDGRIDKFVEERYASYRSGIGAKIRSGETTLAELAAYAAELGAPALPGSGRQEYLESIVNSILFG